MLNLLAQATSDFGDYMPTDIPTSTTADLGTATAFLSWLLPMMGILSVVAVAVYIYFALALFAIAKKTNTPNGWMAWVPIANIILAWQISKFGLLWLELLPGAKKVQ